MYMRLLAKMAWLRWLAGIGHHSLSGQAILQTRLNNVLSVEA